MDVFDFFPNLGTPAVVIVCVLMLLAVACITWCLASGLQLTGATLTMVVASFLVIISAASSRLDGGPVSENLTPLQLVPGQEYRVLFRNETDGVTLVEVGGKKRLLTFRSAPPEKFIAGEKKEIIPQR